MTESTPTPEEATKPTEAGKKVTKKEAMKARAKEAKEAQEENATVDFDKLMALASKAAEKASGLQPVFAKREGAGKKATSWGSLVLDWKTGGGVPPGRVIGIAGPEGGGKSLLATQAIHHQLLAGRVAMYYDAEGATDPVFLRARGIDLDKYRGARDKAGRLKEGERDLFYFYQPQVGEEMVRHMISIMDALPTAPPDIVAPPIVFVTDSVIALVPEANAEDFDANHMAMHARMYSELLPFISGRLSRTGCTWIYINQLRQKPGVTYGPSTYEPAGEALRFFSSMRLSLDRVKPKWGPTSESDHPFTSPGFIDGVEPKAGGVWQEPHRQGAKELDRYVYTLFTTVKNKVYNPFKKMWIRIQFEEAGATGRGLDPVFDVFTFLLELGYIQKATSPLEGSASKAYAHLYEFNTGPEFDPRSILQMPQKFSYWELKEYLTPRPEIVPALREALIVSGIAYERDGE